jgi:hypothetical protein
MAKKKAKKKVKAKMPPGFLADVENIVYWLSIQEDNDDGLHPISPMRILSVSQTGRARRAIGDLLGVAAEMQIRHYYR